MSNIGDLVERMVRSGMSIADASTIIAEAFAAGVASASVRSSGAERQRRYRERVTKRNETSQSDGQSDASQTVTDRHKPSQSDDEIKSHTKNKNIKSIRRVSERASRGTRIDPQWIPSDEDRALAREEGFSDSEIDREALRFRDYWLGRAGSNATKHDWPATWRVWIRNGADKLGKRPAAVTQAAAKGVLVKCDTPQWLAWADHSKRIGKPLIRSGREDGAWVPSEWPPEAQSQHH